MGCNIDKMLIKGIRSFSPENTNVIEFYKPLTLIVGHNGAGKTTVIECLKMSCTGELPPNTRSGQSFIHDPKISGDSEVKAQIKLRFLTSTRQPVIVIRSFQLTQKKATMQYKALDNTLQTVNKTTGQQEALSYRCADIDKVVPAMMGVSKAVLENVIFVHQDESNWPLAEGQVLKKKFDDIFAATRYTKALEELRKLKTRQAQDAREMKLKLEHLKTHKDHAARLRAEAEEGRKKGEALQQEINGLRAHIETLTQQKDLINTRLMSLVDLGDNVKELRAKHGMLVSKNSEVYARLVAAYTAEDLELPLEELESWERDVQPQVADSAGTIRRLERELQSAKLEGEAFKDRYAQDVKAQARLAAEAEAHARNTAERDRFVRKLCGDLNISGLAGDDGVTSLRPETLAAFKEAFGSKLAAVVDSLSNRRSQHQSEDDERGRAIDRLSAQIGGYGEALRVKQDQMRANDARAIELQSQLDMCTGSKDGADAAVAKEASCASRLAAKEQELQVASASDATAQHATAISEIQRRIADLRQERERLASVAEQAARMNYKAQELSATEGKAAETLRRHRGALAVLLGVSPAEILGADAGLKAQCDGAIAELVQKADTTAAAIKSLQAKAATVQGALQATQEQVNKSKSEATILANRIHSGIAASAASSNVLSQVEQLESERKTAQASLQQADFFMSVADKYCSYANSHDACMVCQRKFESSMQRETFIQQQDAQRQRMPAISATYREKVATLDQQLSALKELEPIASRHEKLVSEEIPALEQRVAELQDQASALQADMEIAMVDDIEASRAVTDARALLQEAVLPMERLAKEISERRAEVELLRSAVLTENAARSVADIDSELVELDEKRATHEQSKQHAMNIINKLRDKVSALREELHRAKEEAMRLKSSIERREQLEKQLAERNEATEKLAIELVERKKLQEPLEQQRSVLTKERDGKRAQARAAESAMESELRELQTIETQFEGRERAVADYEERGGAQALEKANRTLTELLRHQEAAEASVASLQDQLVGAKEETGGLEAAMRQVADILAYRRSKIQEDLLANEMDARGAAMAQVGDLEALQAEYRELEAKEQASRSDADRALGALATVNEGAARALAELRHPQYMDVDAKYRKQVIELRTTEMASGDLDKYHKALEKALLSFHTSKMADINGIIKELWQKTYRNSDIDYIQIKADTEGGAARSYNYRVVMSCGGAELDMRGRCSAGQRVLACLIIRLALAETFCLNCGILALDEPTTNLDADNSASLADALRSIMAARREQQNFQLVVITHDEAFARQIGTREHAEYMWRVEKDENQHSTILKEEIMD